MILKLIANYFGGTIYSPKFLESCYINVISNNNIISFKFILNSFKWIKNACSQSNFKSIMKTKLKKQYISLRIIQSLNLHIKVSYFNFICCIIDV